MLAMVLVLFDHFKRFVYDNQIKL